MSRISKAIDALLAQYVNDVLKAEGFSKRRRRYMRQFPDRAELLVVEASTFHRFDQGQFWVHLSIVIPELAHQLRGFTVDLSKARGFESGIHALLSSELPRSRQETWEVIVESQNSEEGERLRKLLIEKGLPWFVKARTKEGLLRNLEGNRSMESLFVRAIINSSAGNYGAAQAALDEVVRRRPDLDEYVRNWAEERAVFPGST